MFLLWAGLLYSENVTIYREKDTYLKAMPSDNWGARPTTARIET